MSRQKDFQVISLDTGTTEMVYIGHVTDPENFYVQLQRTSDSLDEITNLMQAYYKENDSPKEAMTSLALGAPCAALYSDGDWYRARITGLLAKGMVEVLFVDFGNTDFVSMESVCVLRPDLFATPIQSFKCRLQGVATAQDFWSPQHVAQFEDSVLEKSFKATFMSYNPEKECYAVQLVDESGVDVNKVFGDLTGSAVTEASSGHVKRSVQTAGDLDLHVTVQTGGGAPPKPRGLAHALGVTVSDGSSAASISTIPPISLKVGEKVNMTVVYVSTPSEFWCQLKKFSEENDKLAEEMAAAYSSMGPREGLLRNLRPGCVCAALFEVDQAWYRATVEGVSGREVTVFFIDYGNTETVSAGNLRELKEGFRSLPAQAVKCSLSGVASLSGSWTDDAASVFEDMVISKEYVATILSKMPSGSNVVSLFDPVENTDVATLLINNRPDVIKGSAKGAQSPPPPVGGTSLGSFPPLPVRVPSRCQVFVSWVTTPGEFYVQLADNHSILECLTDDLQNFYNGPKASLVASVEPGMMVVAKFSEDQAWYRGVVRGISGNTADVKFIDFGNSEKVHFESLRQLDRQFSNIPAQAVQCSLAGIRPLTQGQTWSGDAKDFLEKLTENGAKCHFVVKKGATYEVELDVEEKSIAREMIAHAVVRGMSEPPSDEGSGLAHYNFEKIGAGQQAEVYVAFADSVESFYVQLADRMQALDDLMAELETYYNSGSAKPLSNPQVGMPCVARYDEDGSWYRAQVRAFTARDVDVFFVDYGNTQVAKKDTVCQMDPMFMSLAAQAIHCSLNMREGRNAEAQLQQFNEFTGDAKLEMVVRSQDGSKLVVDLLKNGVSVTAELKGGSPPKLTKPGGYTPAAFADGQTIQAYASFIESPSKFWIQLAGSDDDIEAMKKALNQHYGSGAQPAIANPSPGQACCALYVEDQSWCRASVLSVHGQQIRVQFVDYGNAELIDRENVKAIAPEFLAQPLLAMECCLEGFQSVPSSDQALKATENLLAENELTVTFTGGKNVRVVVNGADVGEVLSSKGFGGQAKGLLSPKGSPEQAGFGSRSPQGPGKTGGFGAHSPPASTFAPQTLKDPPPPSGSSDAIITHVEDYDGLFFVQLLSAETQLEQLSSKMQSACSSGGAPLAGPPAKDMVCSARFSADGCWYRSKIESVAGSRVKVRFVDYGNAELVQVNTLKAIPSDLLSVPVQAFPCRLKGLQSWTRQTAVAFSRVALDVPVKVRFVGSSSPYDVQISVNGQDLLQQLSRSPASSPQKPFGSSSTSPQKPFGSPASSPQRPFGSSATSPQKPFGSPASSPQRPFGSSPQDRQRGPPPSHGFGAKHDDSWDSGTQATSRKGASSSPQKFSPSPPKPKVPPQVYPPQRMPAGRQDVYVSHVDDDGTFYLQLSQDSEKLEEISAKLQSLASIYHPNPVVGAACAAKFSEDAAWYRAIIRTIAGTTADVMFVDFGNGEKSAISSLRPLPADLLMPPAAYHCQLEETGPLAPEQLQSFSTATEDKQLKAAFSSGTPLSASLWDEHDKNLVETLFPLGTLKLQKVPSEMVPAVVSHVGEDGVFYVQLNSEETDLLTFVDKIQEAYPGEVEKLGSCEEGRLCCAKFSEDDAWYRAVIVKDQGGRASVLFVDYGNEETVDKENILKLLPGLTRPAFAYACCLPGVKWTHDHKEKFMAMTDGKIMNVRFLSSKPPYNVELTRSIGLDLMDNSAPGDGGDVQPVADKVEETEKAVAAPAPEVDNQDLPVKDDTFPMSTPPTSGTGMVSHVDVEGIFYLQLTSEDEAREALSERLQDECEQSAARSVKPVVNMACCAKYSEDGAWYRAVLEKVESECAIVRFIDFGNTDSVPVADLKKVSAESLSVAPLAYRCILKGCESASDEVSQKLEEYTAEHTLEVTFLSPTEAPPYSVNLAFEDGSNVAALFIGGRDSADAEGKQDRETESTSQNGATLKCGCRQKVIVSQVISPSLFYVQLEDQQSELDKLTEAMFEYYSGLAEGDGVVEALNVGQLCASQFGEDDSWYRASVRNIDKEADTCTLFYVDYGNTDTVAISSVRMLQPEFESLPWQSIACSLAGVRCQGEEWSGEVKSAFEELVSNKTLLAEAVAGDGKENPYIVHMLDLGIPVADSLLERGLSGIEAVEVESFGKHVFSDTTVGESLLSDSEDKFEDTVQDATGDDGARPEKRTVDELEDNENEVEFSRQLNQRAAQLESTMLDEPVEGKVSPEGQNDPDKFDSTEEAGEEGKAEEDADDFQDAVEAADAGKDRGKNEEADGEHQAKFSSASDSLTELEWTDVRVCQAKSSTEFWCKLTTAEKEIGRMELNAAAVDDLKPVQDAQVGYVYLVCDPHAANYRAKVLMADQESKDVSVLQVDSGEERTVPKDCLFCLTNDQLAVPAQAFSCCIDDEYQPKHAWFLNMVTRGEICDKNFELKVVGRKTDGTLLVDLREELAQLGKKMDEAGEKGEGQGSEEEKRKTGGEMDQTLEISQPILQSTALGDTMYQSRIEKSESEKEFSVQSLEVGKKYEVTVCPGGVPSTFYISLASSQGVRNALADDLAAEVAEKGDELDSLESAAPGSVCLVQDTASSSWLRGQITSVADELCKVLYVDSGSCVEVNKAELRELPIRLLDTPVQAVQCQLADVVPVEGQWCDDALTFFTDFIARGTMQAYVNGYSEDNTVCNVTLLEQQTQSDNTTTTLDKTGSEPSLNRTLVELGYAEALPGSALDVELQLERTINDPDKMEQLESSFTEVSCQRENSIGDISGDEESAENRTAETGFVDEKGDASRLPSEDTDDAQNQGETSKENPEQCEVVCSEVATSVLSGADTSTEDHADDSDSDNVGATNKTVITPADSHDAVEEERKRTFENVPQKMDVTLERLETAGDDGQEEKLHSDSVVIGDTHCESDADMTEIERCQSLDERYEYSDGAVNLEGMREADGFGEGEDVLLANAVASTSEDRNRDGQIGAVTEAEKDSQKSNIAVAPVCLVDDELAELQTCALENVVMSQQENDQQSPLTYRQIIGDDTLCRVDSQVEPSVGESETVWPEPMSDGEVYFSGSHDEDDALDKDHHAEDVVEGRKSASILFQTADANETRPSHTDGILEHASTEKMLQYPEKDDEKDVLCSLTPASVPDTGAQLVQEEFVVCRDMDVEDSKVESSYQGHDEVEPNSTDQAAWLKVDPSESVPVSLPVEIFDDTSGHESTHEESPTHEIETAVSVPMSVFSDLPLSVVHDNIEQEVSFSQAAEMSVVAKGGMSPLGELSSGAACEAVATQSDQPLEDVHCILSHLVASACMELEEKLDPASLLETEEEHQSTDAPTEVSQDLGSSEREEDDDNSSDDRFVTAAELAEMTEQMENMAVLETDQREAEDAQELLEQMAQLIDQYGNVIEPLCESEVCEGSELDAPRAERCEDPEGGPPAAECGEKPLECAEHDSGESSPEEKNFAIGQGDLLHDGREASSEQTVHADEPVGGEGDACPSIESTEDSDKLARDEEDTCPSIESTEDSDKLARGEGDTCPSIESAEDSDQSARGDPLQDNMSD